VTLVGMLASMTVLLVAGTAFFGYTVKQAREDLDRSMQLRAEMLGSVSAASIVFDDPKAGLELLDALRNDPRMAAAALYRADRTMFVSYQRTNADVFTELDTLLPGGLRWSGEHRLLAQPIDFKGERVGYVGLASDLSYLHDVVRRSVIVALAVLAGCLLLGWVLSNRLQRVVTRPILTVADLAQTIAHSGDYSHRLPVEGTHELATLAASFNTMLQQIERRDAELAAARNALEMRVEERTRELRRQTEELTRSNADLEQFAYVASHDLQEPLRMVASYTQLLAESTKDQLQADAREYIDYAIDGAVRMQNLIADLLAYSRVGRTEIRPAPVATDEIAAQAVANLGLAIADSGAKVVVDPLPPVVGHRTLLIQLFQNLIGNAIKFRGTVPPEIHVTAELRAGAVEFAVRDNGIGFDPKYAPKVFVIFQRLHARGKYPGTGIGLAVCKRIVENHGGRIWVDSTPGKGTTFFFTIAEQQPAAPDSAHEGGGVSP
jgi:signal transduction histidine kinase